jgi:hypothetical protein
MTFLQILMNPAEIIAYHKWAAQVDFDLVPVLKLFVGLAVLRFAA